MTSTPKTIGAESRRAAAFALEDLSKRQQRASVTNLQRAVLLRTDDTGSHQRALASLRQSVGHKVPGWQEMVIALSLLTGEDMVALMEKADKGGKSRLFIDGMALTSDELSMLRLWRKSRHSRRDDALAALEAGQSAQGRAADDEEDRREEEAEERRHRAMIARGSAEPLRVIDGGRI